MAPLIIVALELRSLSKQKKKPTQSEDQVGFCFIIQKS